MSTDTQSANGTGVHASDETPSDSPKESQEPFLRLDPKFEEDWNRLAQPGTPG